MPQKYEKGPDIPSITLSRKRIKYEGKPLDQNSGKRGKKKKKKKKNALPSCSQQKGERGGKEAGVAVGPRGG